MTERIQEVFRLYEIRKTKKEKAAFRSFLKRTAEADGYKYEEQSASFGAKNVIVGDLSRAEVVYTAHYDTCPRLPFPNFITPKCLPIYILYQLLISFVLVAFMLVPPFVIRVLASLLGAEGSLLSIIYFISLYASMILTLWLIMAGPANKHTANDNTSGVTVLLNLMENMPESERGRVAFVFFDLEEMGLIGSSGFAAKHGKALANTPVINFDCVSDGDTIIFALRKGARTYAEEIRTAFKPESDLKVEVLTKGVFYPSDQAVFKMGIGVAALKTGVGGILYMDRIHTSRDTVYEWRNIEYLTRGAIAFIENKRVSNDG